MNLVLDVLDVVVNTLWQAVLIAFAVWLLLRFTPRINAATKYAIWWVTLACVLILPFETQIFSAVKPEQMSAPALRSAAATQAFDVRPSITGTTFLRVQPRRKAVWPGIAFSVWAALLLWQILRIIRSYLYLRGIKKRARSAPA
jgi:beta-lactamase regulating signal transducer with metallopeptidase domain